MAVVISPEVAPELPEQDMGLWRWLQAAAWKVYRMEDREVSHRSLWGLSIQDGDSLLSALTLSSRSVLMGSGRPLRAATLLLRVSAEPRSLHCVSSWMGPGPWVSEC